MTEVVVLVVGHSSLRDRRYCCRVRRPLLQRALRHWMEWHVAIFGERAFLLLLVASAIRNPQKSGGPRPETAAGGKDGAGDIGAAAAKEGERTLYGVRRGASARPVRLLDESGRGRECEKMMSSGDGAREHQLASRVDWWPAELVLMVSYGMHGATGGRCRRQLQRRAGREVGSNFYGFGQAGLY